MTDETPLPLSLYFMLFIASLFDVYVYVFEQTCFYSNDMAAVRPLAAIKGQPLSRDITVLLDT